MKIGIVGVGVVGGATAKVFSRAHEIYPYDKFKEQYNSDSNLETLVKNSEIIFVSVPTPMKPSGAIDYSAIYNSVEMLDELSKKHGRNPEEVLVTIRSTCLLYTSPSPRDS